MRRIAGQAARHGGRLLHALVQLALALVVLLGLAVLGLAWRLSSGPLELPWLVHRLEAAANQGAATQLRIGAAALAWEGFHAGADRPLDLRVTDVRVTGPNGLRLASIPRAEVSLSVARLLRAELVPRSIVLDGPELRVVRGADGALSLDLGELGADLSGPQTPPSAAPADAMLHELTRPASGDTWASTVSPWSQLRRLRVRDAAFNVVDRQLGLDWHIPHLRIDARRRPEGGLEAEGEATITLAEQSAKLSLQASLAHDTRQIDMAARLSAVNPSRIAAALPQLAGLAALDAPVALSGSLRLDAALRPSAATARAELGAGVLHAGTGQAPLLDAVLTVSAHPDSVHAELQRLTTAPRPDGPRTVVTGRADLARAEGGGYAAGVTLDIDRLFAADLPALWPEGTGGPGSRPWVTRNVTDGTLHDGHAEARLKLADDLSDIAVSSIAASVVGDDVTVHWLRPVPPIEKARAQLNLLSPDALEIVIQGGRQAGGRAGGLQIQSGRVTLTGLSEKDQFADIEGSIAGPVPDLLALLRHPRVKLLDRSPVDLRDASGQIAGKVSVKQLPLRDSITMDDVQITTTAKLSGLHIGGLAAGRDIDRAALNLEAGQDGLRASGTAEIAGLPARGQFDMDFRKGPPSQVVQKITASATLDERALATLGLDTKGALSGPAELDAVVSLRRDGSGEALLRGDLTKARLAAPALPYVKPAGDAASLQARAMLNRGALTDVEALRLSGPGLLLDGDVRFRAGQPDVLRLRALRLGEAVEAHGEIRLPASPQEPLRAELSGSVIDLSEQLKRAPQPPQAPPAEPPEPPPGPRYAINARFDRVVLGPSRTAEAVSAQIENDGRVVTRATLAGRVGEKGAFQFTIAPGGKGRVLSGSAADAGALLRALDVVDTMQGGRLSMSGSYDDTRRDHLLSGTAQIADFRIRNAPVLGRILQAMTLYGLVEVARGPGLGFTRLDLPFHYARDDLDLIEARAFSASLGMTAKGRVNLASQNADLQGTIVPAYFFNSLLGNIPLIGRLFSPERGGGLFAATYSVRGPLDDPEVVVNPLAALTPGLLRNLFGLFETAPPKPR